MPLPELLLLAFCGPTLSPIPQSGEPEPNIILDCSAAPDLTSWCLDAREEALDWYPRICNLLASEGHSAPTEIKLVMRSSEKGVAATSGATITLFSTWFTTHPDDVGAVIHELAHVIQAYPSGEPTWITEGIADYIRWAIYEGKPLKWFPKPQKPDGYRDGYRAAAGFLLWLERGAAPGIVRRLNRAMRKGDYSESLFKDLTGLPLPDLWSDYLQSQQAKDNAPVELREVKYRFSEAKGIGQQKGVVRRDPSDVVLEDGVHYVWYTRVDQTALRPPQQRLKNSGYVGTIWYAASSDKGRTWVEKGQALGLGSNGTFDSYAVFTPNVLKYQGKWYLYYTGVKPTTSLADFANNNETDTTAIGVAVADEVTGPFKRVSTQPVLSVAQNTQAFDSYRVDDAALLLHDFDNDNQLEVGLYYKGRSRIHGKSGPSQTCAGLTIADHPLGPFQRYTEQPLFSKSHEVLIWAVDGGVATLASISQQVLFASDGIQFFPVGKVTNRPNAPGAFRPSFTIDAGSGSWGIDMVHDVDAPYLRRFEW